MRAALCLDRTGTAESPPAERESLAGLSFPAMEHHLWNIVEVFEIADRGVIISGDLRECDECDDVPSGHVLQIRRPDDSTFDCDKFSIELFDPPNRERPRHFMLSGEFKKSDVPTGSQLWYIHQSG